MQDHKDLIRGMATLGLVSAGLFVVMFIFFWPLCFMTATAPFWVIMMLQSVHLVALVHIPYPYLYIYRKICYPIRMLLMPLVQEVAKGESIREKEITWYNKCDRLPQTNDIKVLLKAFKYSIRRDLKQKLNLFFQRGITTMTTHSDYLSLKEDIPILWQHEKRAVRGTDKSAVEEFIKHFLVVFLTSNAYIDRYYDKGGNICALGLFVQSKKVLINFLYFCLEEESQSGIWQCKSNHRFLGSVSLMSVSHVGYLTDNHLRGLLRAVSASPQQVEYINFQVHQNYAKRLAGAIGADHKDGLLLGKLYPFAFFKEPSENIIQIQITPQALG